MGSFRSIEDVDELLRTDTVSVRDLHAIWTQRLPVPDPTEHKKSYEAVAAGPQIDWLQRNIRLAESFTMHALEQEEFLLVLEAAREILRLKPKNDVDRIALVYVRKHYAEALTRLGFTRDAREVLEPCIGAGPDSVGGQMRVDVLVQLGNILREESYHAAARAAQMQTAGEALKFYRDALEKEPDRLEVLNLAAAAAFVLGEEGSELRHESQRDAHHVIELVNRVESKSGASWDTKWARATALTMLGQVEEAARCYAELPEQFGSTTARLASARFWTRFLAEALGKPRNLFDGAFPPLQLIVFAGHLPDRRGEPARFPAERIPAMREELRQRLAAAQARVGLVSGSAGADLLFIEALRARGGTVHLVLPWSQDEFRRTSVQPFDDPDAPVWEPLFDRAIAEAATIREIGQAYEPSGDVGWEYMTEVTAGIALYTARASRLDVKPMALWDGRPGRGVGGTDSFCSFWQSELGEAPIVIHPSGTDGAAQAVDIRPRRRCEQSILGQDVKSLLFADIVGYSKLTEKVVGEFIGSFLGRVSQLASSSRHAPCSVNTWGDAVYAVFDFVRDAGLFALDLAQMVTEGRDEWLQKGLYWETDGEKHPLNIRIGLHAGPVVMHYDPVVRRLGFTGSHVSRAARIEPVTKPGQVFASEEFAALAELDAEIRRRSHGSDGAADADAEDGFICEYAGTMQLAKGYPGRYRIYRVVRKRVLALEDLAKAAHEHYCEAAKAHGDTPLTNSALRPWAELTEDLRQANRAAVADIPNKLHRLRYELAPSHGIKPSEVPITEAQVEELAMREHERWMLERTRSGWRYAPKRDNARKHHPLLVPWDQLTETDKDKDRDTIRTLPELIERAGFRVRPIA